jgi:adenylate cyclase
MNRLAGGAIEGTRTYQSRAVGISLALLLIAALLGISVAAAITTGLVRPVRRLLAGTAAVEGGALDTIVPVTSSDEIGRLTESFNRMVGELKLKEQIRDTFGKYVDPRIVAGLLDRPELSDPKGARREMTILFCDMQGFTSFSEGMTPVGLVTVMNRYLTVLSEPVRRNSGIIDKYIGDAVMAFWNAPLDDPAHADHAARAALAMARELEQLNQRWRARADARGETYRDIKFGIGLATGDCCVGNFGSMRRFDYSALGDYVNLASRLEGATKFYQTDILASEATRNQSADLAWLEVDRVRLQGKGEVARIFTLAGDAVTRQSPAFAALADLHDQMLAAYRGSNFEEAAAIAKMAGAAASPPHYDFYVAYESRLRELIKSRPANWTAVTELTVK